MFQSTGHVYMPFDLWHLASEFNYDKNEEPRILTNDEIESIVAVIPRVQATVEVISKHNLSQIKNSVRLQLSEIKLDPTKIEVLKSRIYKRCRRAALQPGENVGLSASESLGQPITQATLNSFHNSGSADVGMSISSMFTEVLGLTKNRKKYTAKIHFRNDNLSMSDVKALSRAFVFVPISSLIENLITDVTIVKDPRPVMKRKDFYFLFSEMNAIDSAYNGGHIPFDKLGKVFLRIKFSPYSL